MSIMSPEQAEEGNDKLEANRQEFRLMNPIESRRFSNVFQVMTNYSNAESKEGCGIFIDDDKGVLILLLPQEAAKSRTETIRRVWKRMLDWIESQTKAMGVEEQIPFEKLQLPDEPRGVLQQRRVTRNKFLHVLSCGKLGAEEVNVMTSPTKADYEHYLEQLNAILPGLVQKLGVMMQTSGRFQNLPRELMTGKNEPVPEAACQHPDHHKHGHRQPKKGPKKAEPLQERPPEQFQFVSLELSPNKREEKKCEFEFKEKRIGISNLDGEIELTIDGVVPEKYITVGTTDGSEFDLGGLSFTLNARGILTVTCTHETLLMSAFPKQMNRAVVGLPDMRRK